jgi:hypothetical protein
MAIRLELVAHVRRLARNRGDRRARASLPPEQVLRQQGLLLTETQLPRKSTAVDGKSSARGWK